MVMSSDKSPTSDSVISTTATPTKKVTKFAPVPLLPRKATSLRRPSAERSSTAMVAKRTSNELPVYGLTSSVMPDRIAEVGTGAAATVFSICPGVTSLRYISSPSKSSARLLSPDCSFVRLSPVATRRRPSEVPPSAYRRGDTGGSWWPTSQTADDLSGAYPGPGLGVGTLDRLGSSMRGLPPPGSSHCTTPSVQTSPWYGYGSIASISNGTGHAPTSLITILLDLQNQKQSPCSPH